MKNWKVYLGVSLVLTTAALVALFLWLVPKPCDPDTLKLASDAMKGVVFSCGEFWLNRYQSLIGNLLTALVAFVTLIWLGRQLRATSVQAATDAAEALTKRIDLLRIKQAKLTNATNYLFDVYIKASDDEEEKSVEYFRSRASNLRRGINELTAYLADVAARDGEYSTIDYLIQEVEQIVMGKIAECDQLACVDQIAYRKSMLIIFDENSELLNDFRREAQSTAMRARGEIERLKVRRRKLQKMAEMDF